MKKSLMLLLTVFFLVSCVSTNIEYYSNASLTGNKVYLQIEQNTSAVETGGVGFTTGYGWSFMSSSSETIKLGTIKNKETIKSGLENKGYVVVNSIDESDIVLIGESTSNVEYSLVTLGFYNKESGTLLFTCEGKYGLGSGMQDDLNKAVKKALESVPAAK